MSAFFLFSLCRVMIDNSHIKPHTFCICIYYAGIVQAKCYRRNGILYGPVSLKFETLIVYHYWVIIILHSSSFETCWANKILLSFNVQSQLSWRYHLAGFYKWCFLPHELSKRKEIFLAYVHEEPGFWHRKHMLDGYGLIQY